MGRRRFRAPRGGSRLVYVLVLVCAAPIALLGADQRAQAAPTSMPLISRGVPVFASSQIYPATSANDSDYSTQWRGTIPGWIALDLSRVPAAQRGQVIVAWYNDPDTSPYDHTVVGDVAYDNLRDYTVQANPAPGGTAAPTTGWVTLATVTGNRYHSRQHLVDMTGYNWIRLNITAGDGSSGNTDAAINLDVHDASQGAQDSWIFFGDSVTEDGMFHHSDGSSVGNFAQLINAARPGNFPAYEDGGIWGTISADGASHMATWLTTFPGKYVTLDYGTNDANGCGNTTTFYNNYVTMVQAVLAAGKVPVVPTIPWARTANVQSCGPGFNAKIQALYAAYPQIVRGPDFWAFFSANQSLIGSDNLHPSTAGYGAYRQQWANTMLSNVYAASSGPAVTLTPSSLAFGSQRTGTASAPQSVTVGNTGNAPLTISSIALAGAYPGDYAESTNCPLSPSTLAAGSSCTVSVTFQPTATGSRPAAVSITDNAPDSPQSVTLSGTGTAPAVTVTPASLSFGSQIQGTTSAAQTSTLRNSGTAPLAISGISVGGTNAGDFAQSNTCPASLAVSATCTISVTFTPTDQGSRTGNVSISDDAPGTPQTIGLNGTGAPAAPAATLTPASLTFPSQLVGTTSAAQTSTLRDTGSAPLVIAGLGLTGSNAADYSESDDCPSSLAVNATCTISVTFTPTGAGTRIASVQVNDNAADSPQPLALSGTGANPAPAVTLTPSSLSFGSQRVGTASAPQTVSLSNNGTAPLAITSIGLAGSSAGDYTESNDCPQSPVTLSVGTSCTITIGFVPTAAGSRQASVSITDNAPDSPQSLPLSGTGTAPAVTLTPSSLSFGSQLQGTTSAVQTSTLRNSGTAPLAISGINVGGTNGGDFAQTNTCPASLAVSATCTISVTFTPGGLGARSASVNVSDDAPGSPQAVALSGAGTNTSVAFDKNLGTYNQNVGSTTMKLTTSAAAVSGSRVFVFVTWNNATRTLTSLTGGGLTWTVDVQAKDASNNHGAIVSAAAPAGLPSNSALTATFSGSVGHGLMAAASFTGIASSGALDAAGTSVQAGVTGWSANVATANANDLVLGWSGIDANATSTATSPNVEIQDFGDQWFDEWATSVYRIESSAGAKTVNGVWSRNTGSTANVTVAAAYKAG